jgi:glycosyltransferase involved in cell wall biosynthesis
VPPSDDRARPSCVSVVIPAYNAAGVIGGQLHALTEQDYDGPWEVIVADNGSTDPTAEVARAWASRLPSLRVVDASAIRGVSHARNRGAAEARGEVILVCDADDEAAPGWVSAMVAALGHHDLVGGWLDPEPLNDAWSRSSRPDFPRDTLPRSLDFLPFAVGANTGVRTEVVAALGGWDEDYADGGDDIDFSWRAQLAGFSIGAAPDAVMRYRHRSGWHGVWRQYVGYGSAEPKLYAAYRAHGLPRTSPRSVLARWTWLAARAPLVATGRRPSAPWIGNVARHWGRCRGSLRHRALYL